MNPSNDYSYEALHPEAESKDEAKTFEATVSPFCVMYHKKNSQGLVDVC